MADEVGAQREKREANEKLPSKAFIKKYKWWIVAGLGIGLVVFMFVKSSSSSSTSSGTSATGDTTDTSSEAIDPNTGVPYATELAQAQEAAAAGYGSAAPASSDGTSTTSATPAASTGTTTTGTTTATGTTATGTTATGKTTTGTGTSTINVNVSLPGTPVKSKQPARKTAPKPITVKPPVKATLLPYYPKPAVKRAGYPATVTTSAAKVA